ncbi:MAG: hypothetical protein DRQ08_03190 [Candidatus Latescibacterota bacterium]|nr:MAG: hypothetical protein DRQ08_03190 [Candidatus Latescibacterota bacterium]
MKDIVWSFGGLAGAMALILSLISGVSPSESIIRAGVVFGVSSGAALVLLGALSQILERPEVEHKKS